jgi:hypothetical protein
MLAQLRRNILYKNTLSIDHKDLRNVLHSCLSRTAYVTAKHIYLARDSALLAPSHPVMHLAQLAQPRRRLLSRNIPLWIRQ